MPSDVGTILRLYFKVGGRWGKGLCELEHLQVALKRQSEHCTGSPGTLKMKISRDGLGQPGTLREKLKTASSFSESFRANVCSLFVKC